MISQKMSAPYFYYKSTYPGSPQIKKRQDTDAGYVITLNTRPDNRPEDLVGETSSFGTGLFFQDDNGGSTIARGYYLKLHEDHNLYKTGYTLVGSRVIDRSHKGELIISLKKEKPGADLDLPYEAVFVTIEKEVPGFFRTIHTQQPQKQPNVYAPQFAQPSTTYTPPPNKASYTIPSSNVPSNAGAYF